MEVISINSDTSLDDLWDNFSGKSLNDVYVVFGILEKSEVEKFLKLIGGSFEYNYLFFLVDDKLIEQTLIEDLLDFYFFLIDWTLYSPFSKTINNILQLLMFNPNEWDLKAVSKWFFRTDNISDKHLFLVSAIRSKIQEEVLRSAYIQNG